MTAPDDCPDLRFAIEWRTAREYERRADFPETCVFVDAFAPASDDVMALYYYLEFWRQHTEAP